MTTYYARIPLLEDGLEQLTRRLAKDGVYLTPHEDGPGEHGLATYADVGNCGCGDYQTVRAGQWLTWDPGADWSKRMTITDAPPGRIAEITP